MEVCGKVDGESEECWRGGEQDSQLDQQAGWHVDDGVHLWQSVIAVTAVTVCDSCHSCDSLWQLSQLSQTVTAVTPVTVCGMMSSSRLQLQLLTKVRPEDYFCWIPRQREYRSDIHFFCRVSIFCAVVICRVWYVHDTYWWVWPHICNF